MKWPLYQVLGVKTSATTEEIHAAYRKLSKKYHPDMKTGNADKFAALSIAHDVLSDPNTRAYYDRTGQIKPTVPEGHADAEMYNLITQIMQVILQQTSDVESLDLMRELKTQIAGNKSQIQETLYELEKKLKKLTAVQKRITAKTASTIMLSLVNSQVTVAQNNVDKAKEMISILDRAVVFVDDYDYDFTPRKASAYQSFGGWGGTTA